MRGDTTFVAVSDGSRRVLLLSRAIRVDPARQMMVHDSVQFAMAMVYEAPAICPEGADATVTEVRRWNSLDRQLVLMNHGSGEVRLEVRADHPRCADRAGTGPPP